MNKLNERNSTYIENYKTLWKETEEMEKHPMFVNQKS